jgi:hypothetical protein
VGVFCGVITDEDAGEIVCILDALDECQNSDISLLLKAITNLYSNGPKCCNVKFLLTSRAYGHIKREFRKLEKNFPTIHLCGENEEETKTISVEVDLVIGQRVDDIGKSFLLDEGEIQDLKHHLTLSPNRTSLWVALILEIIENLRDFELESVSKIISELPRDTNAA